MKPAAIYARVSSDKQKEEHTTGSQTEALRDFARQHGFNVPDEWVIEDEGYSVAHRARVRTLPPLPRAGSGIRCFPT